MKVYLAGPEVFLSNAREQLDRKIALTRAAGLIPVAPGDLAIPETPTKRERGLAISAIDEQLMSSADAIIANLTPFRGAARRHRHSVRTRLHVRPGQDRPSPIPTPRPTTSRAPVAYYGGMVVAKQPTAACAGRTGMSVEDFEMAENLMLDGGVESRGGRVIVRDVPSERLYTDTAAFEECLGQLCWPPQGATLFSRPQLQRPLHPIAEQHKRQDRHHERDYIIHWWGICDAPEAGVRGAPKLRGPLSTLDGVARTSSAGMRNDRLGKRGNITTREISS